MNSMERLRERYERKISEIENREQIVTIAKWVGAALTAAIFIVGVVKAVLLIVERASAKKRICCEVGDGCDSDSCTVDPENGEPCCPCCDDEEDEEE